MVAKSLKLANINIKYDEHVDKGDYGSDTDTASKDYDPQNINDHQNENEMAIDDRAGGISNFDTGIRYLFTTGIYGTTGYTVFSVITEITLSQ